MEKHLSAFSNVRPRALRTGFTLIEILVVISIIVVLATVLTLGLLGAFSSSNKSVAEANIAMIESSLGRYELRAGQYPASSLKMFSGQKLTPPNPTNEGIECLVIALRTGMDGGPFLEDSAFQDMRINVDGDMNPDRAFKNPVDVDELWELADPWGNPYVYVHADELSAANYYPTAGGLIAIRNQDGEQIDVDITKLREAVDRSPGGLPGKRFLIWSFGENGENEYGEGDDVASWNS